MFDLSWITWSSRLFLELTDSSRLFFVAVFPFRLLVPLFTRLLVIWSYFLHKRKSLYILFCPKSLTCSSELSLGLFPCVASTILVWRRTIREPWCSKTLRFTIAFRCGDTSSSLLDEMSKLFYHFFLALICLASPIILAVFIVY